MTRFLLLAYGLLCSGHALAVELTVSAASSLTNAFRELAPLYEAKHPDTKLQLNFAASGALLQQIAKGAPVDVLATADQETMNQAQERGLIDAGQRRDFASNSLVVVVPAQRNALPGSLNDLTKPEFERVAIGLPASVPVGRYTKRALENVGVWADIQPKMIGAHNVRQALDYVARGEVDAGFVYATDVAMTAGKVKPAFTVATEQPILYPLAPVARSDNADAALAFVDFVASDEARAILSKHGFGQP